MHLIRSLGSVLKRSFGYACGGGVYVYEGSSCIWVSFSPGNNLLD